MLSKSIFQPRNSLALPIVNKDEDTTFYLYDEIGDYGVSAKDIVKGINAVKKGTIHFRINSPGGAVFDGLSIYNAIKESKVKTIAHIDGLAASIASVIAIAADEVKMADNAFFMIHEPWSIAIGNADIMRKEADLLEKVAEPMLKSYIERSKHTDEEIKAWMAAETWFTADEAREAGFADAVEEIDAEARTKFVPFDLSVYKNVPDQLREIKDKDVNERDLEKALRDVGCSRNLAKEILAKGFQSERDAHDEPVKPDVRDAQKDDKPPLRDAEPPKKKDKIADLLTRAEVMAPTKRQLGGK
jgi:ATP-dependent Clp protease, protease subunit